MTECNQSQFEFEAHFTRRVVAEFSGELLTTEGGALLLRAADRKIGLLRRVVRCFTDARAPQRIEHELSEMLVQRIYGLALGYEDLNDHEELRNDPLLGMLAGRRDRNAPLAGKSTLNRLERTPSEVFSASRYHKIGYSPEAIDELLVDIFLEAHRQAPREIVLDLDATDTPLHGRQEARFFHGYYGHYCYLPLYVFCGDHLLCARLRPSNIDASAGSLEEVQRLVRQIRARWPKTRIILRADSGFCREELLAWCEEQLSLFADRMSTETLRANQLRLYFSSLAYVLVEALRRLGLAGTEWAEAQADTIRLKLLKIAAQVRITARRIWVRYSCAYPWQNVFAAAWTALRC